MPQKKRRFCWLPIGGNNGDYLGGNANILTLTQDPEIDPFENAVLLDFGNAYCHTSAKQNYVMPDLDALFPAKDPEKKGVNKPSKSKLKAILLTHYHDDHIKGLADAIIRKRDLPPIVAPKMTLDMLDAYLERQGYPRAEYTGIIAEDYKPITIGDWRFTTFPVGHSTVDCKGYVIEADGKRVVHMGDYKLDQTVMLGEKTNLEFLKKLGDEGVDCLILDSTKAEQDQPYFYNDEGTRDYLKGIIRNNEGTRCVFVVYGAYLELIAMMMWAAAKNDKAVVISGTYIKENIKAFEEQHGPIEQYIKDKTGVNVTLIDDEEQYARMLLPSETIVIADGDMVGDKNNFFRKSYELYTRRTNCPTVLFDDKVFVTRSVLSNDRTGQLIEYFKKLQQVGVEFFGPNEHQIKARGHAPWVDLRETIKLLKPKAVMPAYGKKKMLKAAHEKITKEFGAISYLLENGDMIDIAKPKEGILHQIKVKWAGVKYKVISGFPRVIRQRIENTLGPNDKPVQEPANKNSPQKPKPKRRLRL